MADIKNQVQDINANLTAVDIEGLAKKTGNIYTALNIIGTRARQLNREIKTELQGKLEEFAVDTDVARCDSSDTSFTALSPEVLATRLTYQYTNMFFHVAGCQ